MRKAVLIGVAAALLLAAVEAAAGPRGRRAPAGERTEGYYTDYVTGPPGRKTPTMQVPGSTTVITRQMMDDVQARSLCDALRMAPGVTTGGCR